MNIGEPQREIEIVPTTVPVPEVLPVAEPSPDGEPVPGPSPGARAGARRAGEGRRR